MAESDQNGNGSTVESILKVLLSQLSQISKSETVTGTPIQADKTTIIPVSRVAIGFAAGGTDAGGETGGQARRARLSVGGTGGGITVEPIAFIVVGPDQHPQLLPVKAGAANSLARVIDLIPDAVAKIAALRNPAASNGASAEKPKELASGEPVAEKKHRSRATDDE